MILFFKNILNTIISFGKIILQSKFKTNIPQTNDKTCILLGNGPSLKNSIQLHESFIKNHSLICVNSFSITNEYSIFKPTYYVILDYSFWKGNNDLIDTTFIAINEKTTWKLHLLVPQMARHSKRFEQLKNKNTNIELHYFNYTVFKGFGGIAHFFYKHNLAMPQSQNVLVASLFLSINIGFKTIYLLGADHTWHQTLTINAENVVCLSHIHFYDKEEKVDIVPFYKGVHTKEVFTMQEIFTAWAKVYKGYNNIEKYSTDLGATIYNASEVSFIDAFKRKKITK